MADYGDGKRWLSDARLYQSGFCEDEAPFIGPRQPMQPTEARPARPPLREPRHKLVAPSRFYPTWDTLAAAPLVDFLFDMPVRQGPDRPVLWVFATDCADVPTVSDLWLHNGLGRPLPMLRLSLFSTELRQSEGVRIDAADLIYTHILPGEAVRIERVDTLASPSLPRALWFELNMPSGQPMHLSLGPDRWDELPRVMMRG